MAPHLHDRSPSLPCVNLIPQFVLKVENLSHPGALIFFESVKPQEALKLAVEASYTWLYSSLRESHTFPPHVETITLVLKSFDGIAYTTSHTSGTREIHFSLDWINASRARARDEILGVLVHEVVHCYQYNGNGTCPSGVIEGIADFVRLQAGYVPPHWRPRAQEKWDTGYDATAYFLGWIEKRCGKGTIQRLNGTMKDSEYNIGLLEDIIGSDVDSLYRLYCAELPV